VRPPSPFGAALVRLAQAATMIVLAQGCALTPGGLREERASMVAAGVEFRRGPAPADLPVPADGNDWRTLLRRALIANGDVRAAWFEWKAGVERVRGASAWPNTNIAVGYSYMFSDENVKTFDRMSFSAGIDTMENLSFPGKTMAAGRVALSDARAAGQRFRAAKFAVQRRVLDEWLDLAMAAENARLADENTALAGVGADAADAALESGGEQARSFEARIASARSRDAAAAARADIAAAKARLAALTATDNAASIATPTRLPFARRLPDDPAVLIAAVEEGPEVKGLQADRQARKHEEALARLQWIPDINPYAAVTGSVEQGVGAMVMLPTVVAEIQSGIAVAKAMRGAAASRLVQSRRDRGGEVRAMLVQARDAERARRLLEEQIVPAAASVSSVVMSGYSAGRSDLADLVEARTLLIDARKEAAVAAVEREKALAAIEEILGADLETFTQTQELRFAGAAPTSSNRPMQETSR
ncbi:MAG: TolC family protein, partial [Candidatus Binatia bacterium]